MNESRKSDKELVENFQDGDVREFNELVKRYQQKVYWIARRIVTSHHEADDITQDVFVRVFESLKQFRGESNFYTWLYRIATNIALNALRKQRVREFLRIDDVQAPIVDSSDGPVDQLDRKEFDSILEQAIARLPAKQKMVFVMRYYEEMPYEDMAKILKRSVGGLKANYFHALKKIKTYVQQHM